VCGVFWLVCSCLIHTVGVLEGPFELGSFSESGQGKRNDFKEAASFIQQGGSLTEAAARWPTLLVKYGRGFEHLSRLSFKPELRDIDVWLLYGDSGIGKSRFVYQAFGLDRVYVLASESPLWFDGYRGQDVLHIEEFSGLIGRSSLLRLLDVNPYLAAIKASVSLTV